MFFLSLGILFLPKTFQYYYTFILQVIIIVLTSFWSFQVLLSGETIIQTLRINILGTPLQLVIDQLSAFFILVVNFTSFTSLLYAKGYLKSYEKKRTPISFALHYFSFFWLCISMLLVCMIREGLLFLIVWEIMSISSFVLVIFESEKKQVLKTGMKYLIQMHIGVLFLIIGFLYAHLKSGDPVGFDGLELYFRQYEALPIFLIFFIGFGIKSGFIPLHTWLPDAHPVAPSHVSGLMSGVMIKMGIYGILRVLSFIHSELLPIGIFITIISIISGLLGVIYAIVQHDLKKLLAYHSIENIGIIGIGIGLGVIGLATQNHILAFLGFIGGILHILNHSLFKSLLFYAAGSVYQKTHTKYIEHLGGLIKKMPYTALFFLLASLAICGLPPFNGFISEFLIYSGAFTALEGMNFTFELLLFGTILSLALIGGLAMFCFTKVFSIVFLGNPRSPKVAHAHEVTPSMRIPQFFISFFIVLIGLAPFLFLPFAAKAASIFLPAFPETPELFSYSLYQISLLGGGFILLVIIGFWIKKMQQKRVGIKRGSTWGCAYTGSDIARHQYTATSFADNHLDLLKPLFSIKKHYKPFQEEEIFPKTKKFKSHADDIFEEKLIHIPLNFLKKIFSKNYVLQSGQIHHYIVYALFFLSLIFFLSLFDII